MEYLLSRRDHVCTTHIKNLSVKVRKEYILKNLNLSLNCGELTAIIGKNGAGKSTFMKALLNVIPHTGSIIFEGERCLNNCNKEHTKEHSRFCSCTQTQKILTTKPRFGYVPQSLHVESSSPVSVEDLVLSCISKRPVWLKHRQKDKDKVKEILTVTKAQNLTKRRVCDLSGGELQRVMLALAIHPVPDILLLDEPVSGVDRAGLKDFYNLVSELRHSYDITIILISHDLDLVARHADRVVFINNSQAMVGNVEEIYKKDEFTEAFGHIMLPEEYENETTSDKNENGENN